MLREYLLDRRSLMCIIKCYFVADVIELAQQYYYIKGQCFPTLHYQNLQTEVSGRNLIHPKRPRAYLQSLIHTRHTQNPPCHSIV